MEVRNCAGQTVSLGVFSAKVSFFECLQKSFTFLCFYVTCVMLSIKRCICRMDVKFCLHFMVSILYVTSLRHSLLVDIQCSNHGVLLTQPPGPEDS